MRVVLACFFAPWQVLEGKLWVKIQTGKAEEVTVNVLSRGDIFGELAFIKTGKVRCGTIVGSPHCVTARNLHALALTWHWGPRTGCHAHVAAYGIRRRGGRRRTASAAAQRFSGLGHARVLSARV